ncbi:lysozyme inhibitor LprI family protein [Stenotrophomonas rhizophila]|uniref:lysozyme inhibitor LprI family protein n=1 Tax=Stenotrophomonas rhizophila TaxID=216778 RepID=UPI00224B71B6|nr:lysozyme inhibitor LprI family protein [Stenotrophomonas rhizophila]MCX2920603.1 lysozyme inhibitor LprI family protein [Stenotrophomonas rhizophila]
MESTPVLCFGRKITPYIIAGLAMVAVSTTAHAASFDCAKASTPVEEMVCGNEVLSELDSALADAYAVARVRVMDDGALLRAEQRQWIASRRNSCDTEACLEAVYRDRVIELRLVGGYEDEAQIVASLPGAIKIAAEPVEPNDEREPEASYVAEASDDLATSVESASENGLISDPVATSESPSAQMEQNRQAPKKSTHWSTYAIGAILVLGVGLRALAFYRRDIKKQCPKCKEAGALEKLGERIVNRRRRTGQPSSTGHRITRTTEYWRAKYKCQACAHSFEYAYTQTHRNN